MLSTQPRLKSCELLDLTNDMLGYQKDVGYDYYEGFKQNELTRETVKYLRTIIDKGHRVLSVGAGRGEHEMELIKEGFDIQLSDINPKVIDNTKELFPNIKISLLDILDEKSTENCLDMGPYDIVFVPSLFYMLDDRQSILAMKNIRKLVSKNGILCLAFRSRDTWITRIVDHILCPIDTYVQMVYRRLRGEEVYVDKVRFGYRRTLNDMSFIASTASFALVATDFALCEHEIKARLPVFNRLRLSSLFCFLAGEKSPYLNFLVFK